jgi:ferredoxin-thioredoxin reductase catalytic subunit
MNYTQINTNFEQVRKVINGLESNFNKYGSPYCPCKIKKIDSNICPCEDLRTIGKCVCKLFSSPSN